MEGCHGAKPLVTEESALPRILLVGHPNVGKSVVFNLFTGRYVSVSNYPGTTVEVATGHLKLHGKSYEVYDTPGVNSLLPMSEEEQVTRDIVLAQKAGALIQIGDAKNLRRTLLLTFQLMELGLPMVLCLNMWDEALDRHISIDTEELSRFLGVKVIPTIATHRKGTDDLIGSVAQARPAGLKIQYEAPIEEALREMEPLLPAGEVSRRAMALMLLAGDTTLREWLFDHVSAEDLERIEKRIADTQTRYAKPLGYVLNEQRRTLADRITEQVYRAAPQTQNRFLETLGRWAMHPLLGLPILAVVLYVMWWFVGLVGAKQAVDVLENGLFGNVVAKETFVSSAGGSVQVQNSRGFYAQGAIRIAMQQVSGGYQIRLDQKQKQQVGGKEEDVFVPFEHQNLQLISQPKDAMTFGAVEERGAGEYFVSAKNTGGAEALVTAKVWQGLCVPAVAKTIYSVSPSGFLTRLLVGDYGVITMALTYSLAIILPVIITFFLFFGFLEDSGYVPRLAIMSNRLFRVMGLNGKAVLPMVLGLGCDTMATFTTRVLETRRERIIVTLLLTLGVPCSAQLAAIFGLLGSVGSPYPLLIWLVTVIGTIFLVGALAARVLPGPRADFVLEVPPIRWPLLGNILIKTLARLRWYLREAVPLFIIGTIVLFVLAELNWLVPLHKAASPVVRGVLGLPEQAAEVFLIGFLRRDYGAAGLFRMNEQGLFTVNQIVVTLVVLTLFLPCIAQFFVMVKEQGLKVGVMITAFCLVFALAVGAALNAFLNLTRIYLR